MNVLKQIRELVLLMFGAAAIAGGARAQDPQEPPAPQSPEGPGKPKPAARGVPGLNDSNTAEENDQQSSGQPENSPVTGLQNPTIGSPELGHSYWVPGLAYGSTIQSRPLGQQATSGWYANNYGGGDLSLVEAWSHSQLALNYSGGGFFTTSNR